MKESLGICVGASTIGIVKLRRSENGTEVLWAKTKSHEGDSRGKLLQMISEIDDIETLSIAATGRKFRHLLSISNISEPEAVEIAFAHTLPKDHPCRTIISAGGETFMVYHLDNEGKIQEIHTGNKCASGTGEFLLQQLGRMAISLQDVQDMQVGGAAHKVSGRCSVFCKSDCTHALNKGIPKMQIVSGLTKMMSGKCLELMKKLSKDHALLIGGCANNQFMTHFLQQEIDNLVIPEEAPWFEALGAGLWALDNETQPYPGLDKIYRKRGTSFSYLKPLNQFKDSVQFKTHPRGEADNKDEVILGLDVGSTTTKGVLMRTADKAILAADYLRTDGDPVGASRNVYKSLADQLDPDMDINIIGLGVTGSGRAIAGLHAQTEGVINEIIAHATAAVHFDPGVDTIFEIGGQDAKYTYITNGVPSDYAMNEACSAGTGSFLEESAKETLGVEVTRIGKMAYQGEAPPNFNDQCAAFISSDIKIATQEGLPLNDILAGLVYSICMNYTNRVKGNRPVGNKVFMQGGVCYNEAVPAAMAALTGKEIIVPPEPGLMGAFGVALEVQNRMEQGILERSAFDLSTLISREVTYRKPFACKGGKEKCDRGCEISRIEIEGKIFPFGGICNRYENIIRKRKVDASRLNLVRQREKRVFQGLDHSDDGRPTVGMNRSYLVNTYFPLFHSFFKELGFRLVLPEEVIPEGVDQRGSAFCFPGEISHGFMADLLKKKPDYLFLPHMRGIPTETDADKSCTCVLVQGEPFYLRAAFPDIENYENYCPTLDFAGGIEHSFSSFLDTGKWLGQDEPSIRRAFEAACEEQRKFHADLKEMGRQALEEIESNPEETAVILFGRPYNAFAAVANKAIPAKFATRNVRIIPFDMLPIDDHPLEEEMNMYWGMGRLILKGAKFVVEHPQLFGCAVTNFSCGPDSFLIGYLRDLMGRKPTLTLELDSHTADAGLETRIEAFLDIVAYYRNISGEQKSTSQKAPFTAARINAQDNELGVTTSEGQWLPLTHERVKMVFPAINFKGTQLLAKSLMSGGIRAEALPPADEELLKIGRGNSSCKECLPLQLTIGSMLNYLDKRDPDEVTIYFMPSAGGPCRFGQYNVFSTRTIEKHQIPNATVFSPTSLKGYGGLSERVTLRAWRTIVLGDLFEEMWSTILAGASDVDKAKAIWNQEHARILDVVDKDWKTLSRQIKQSAKNLAGIELNKPYAEIPKISLVGEIYVRHDPISRQKLIERMAERGFIVRTSQVTEWMKYTDWLIKTKIEGQRTKKFWLRYLIKRYFDRRIRKLLAPSGLFYNHVPEIQELVDAGEHYLSKMLTGEAILTVGAALHEILSPSCGIISIGPFGCMPSRLAESILSEKFTTGEIKRIHPNTNGQDALLSKNKKLPFLAIETDGNPFPQVIEARLEAFCLQANRLHEELLENARDVLS